jgi:hypothetical protein
METIYAVFATHEDRSNVLLDYASGNPEDIEAYFSDQKARGLELRVVDPIVIESGYENKRNDLLSERAWLEQKLSTVTARLSRPRASGRG